ncbi:VOC family protein [Kineosporia sp. NBRC 101731]|uniref:VOC family protein n=1 Tax=Kineosporia sp. NBRC 101731 TaxID=3032199 RepID=UPI0024A4B55C|nr:VOC family protein [Kineosporia sp. NBRC 101731]GLY30087.1 glyoxalase [Kineosporia sp. NBRC 101731]
MAIRTERWRAGTPCWTELSAVDVDDARAFYGPLLGWSFERSPSEHSLVIATVDGAEAAGITEIHEDAPTGWLIHFAADDLRATAEAVVAHGGQILLPPRSAGTRGHRAVACDPAGAPFGLWQAGDAIGSGHVRDAGAFVWDDLRSSDPTAAREFYRRIFGFDNAPLPPEMGAGDTYQTYSHPDEEWPLGGIGPMMGEDDASPYWLAYFQVRSITEALEFVESTGGRITGRDFDSPFGRMAAIKDPDGNRLWLMEPPAAP